MINKTTVPRRSRPKGTQAHILLRYEKTAFIQVLCTPQGIKQRSPLKGDYAVAEILCLAGVARRGLRRISYQDTKKTTPVQELWQDQGTKQRSPLKGDYAVAKFLNESQHFL